VKLKSENYSELNYDFIMKIIYVWWMDFLSVLQNKPNKFSLYLICFE